MGKSEGENSVVEHGDEPFTAGTVSFAILPQELREVVANMGSIQMLSSGEALFRKGEVGDAMYIVESGEVLVYLDYRNEPKVLGVGQFLGEISLLAPGVNRTGTAIARGNCRVRVLTLETINKLKSERPELLCSLLQETCAYLVASEHHLFSDLRRRNRELEHTLDYLQRTQEELVASDLLAQTDELTGIYNRRCLNIQLPKFIERSERTGAPLAVLLLDLNRLKLINDTRGREVGDIALKKLGTLLKDTTRKSDLPCRIGGGEFVVLLSNAVDDVAFGRSADIVRSVSAIELSVGEVPVHLTVSAGGTMLTAGDDAESLLKRADLNLYVAKDHGRNTIVWKGRVRPQAK
ncbi:MAG: GGDEF domain-containing protein [Kofleriaceae bacterium]|nr:GGDEF domain-containing protein [Kofleriaceae bacterium]